MPDPIADLQAALADRYVVQRELGRGGMATVFLAADVKHRRPVALKVLHPELAAAIGAERFLREIEIAARLQHPHILPLYDSGAAQGFLYYVMPYVEGESLRERLTREKQLPFDETVRIASEVASALAYAHGHGIVHRDVKPENIMLAVGTAVVTDFGIARAITAAENRPLTQTGTILGTPAYMSPEQATGQTELDGRSDEYSLACVVYEMLVGEPPFTGPTAHAIIARHSLDTVSPPSIVRATIPEAAEDAILRALAKVPADRFPTTTLFADALARPSRVTGASRWTGASRPGVIPRRWPVPRAVLGGVAVLAVVAAGWAAARALRGRPAASGELDPRHIAVLYFEDLSAGHALGFVADGLTEALIEQLGQVPSLAVISQNGVAPYRNPDLAPDSVARALAVGTVVRGTVEPAGDRYRVTVRLIDGASGADFRRASFEQPQGNLLAIRDSLAREVAIFLRERLGEEVELRQARAGTSSAAAWSFLQQAEKARKIAEEHVAGDSLPGAFASFSRADSLLALAEGADPRWAEPVVLRGQIAYRRARLAPSKQLASQWLTAALAHAERALALVPGFPPALELRGAARYTSWLQEPGGDSAAHARLLAAAREDLEGSTRADPTLASAFNTLSHLYYQVEDVPAAVLAARKAYEQDAYLRAANDILWRLFIGSYDLEQFGQAQRWCDEGVHRFPAYYRFTECRLVLMTTDAVRPEPTEAWRLLARLDSLTPAPQRARGHHEGQMLVGAVLARAGLKDSARRVLVAARPDRATDPQQELLSFEAFARTILGDRDTALALLERYVAANPAHAFKRGGDISWWWRDLRNDPRFSRLERTER